MPMSKKKVNVSLEVETIKYLDNLALKADRDRSWVIGALARLHAELSKEKQMYLKLPDPAEEVINFN